MEAFSFKDHFVHTNMSQLMYKRRNVLWLSFKWLRLPQSNNQVGIYIETLGQFQRRYFLSKRKVGSFDLDFWAIVIHCSPKTKLCLHADQIHNNAIKNIHPTFFKKEPQVLRKKKKRLIIFSFFSAKVPSWLKVFWSNFSDRSSPAAPTVNIPFAAVDSEHLSDFYISSSQYMIGCDRRFHSHQACCPCRVLVIIWRSAQMASLPQTHCGAPRRSQRLHAF